MNGFYATIVAVLSIFVAWLWGKTSGKKETETKISGEVTILRKEKEIKEDTLPAVEEVAQKQTQAESEYEHTQKEIEQAKRTNDMDWMKRIAEEMAQKALDKGATQK